jgi:hypothetical protein
MENTTQSKRPGELSIEMKQEKERLLWAELRDIRGASFKMLQWGVTVLAALQTAIFFLRKDVYEGMLARKELQPSGQLPLSRYLAGTVLLLIVAGICSYLVVLTGVRYRKIRQQLIESNIYGIDHGKTSKSASILVLLVFFAFPILDIAIRIYFHFDVGFK